MPKQYLSHLDISERTNRINLKDNRTKFKKICLLYSTLDDSDLIFMKEFSSLFEAEIVHSFGIDVTHLVVRSDDLVLRQRTMKYFKALTCIISSIIINTIANCS